MRQDGEVRFTSVIRIDKAEVQRLAPLINIRYAGRGQFDDRLAEAVHQAGTDKRLQGGVKIVEKERIIRSEQLLRIVQHNAFIAFIAVDPVGSLLGLAQRFFHKSKKTRLECFQPCGIVGQQRCRPHAGERLIDHPRIRRVRRRTVVQKTHLGLIHLTPARKVFRPQLRGFR